jgi:hypothetical protein
VIRARILAAALAGALACSGIAVPPPADGPPPPRLRALDFSARLSSDGATPTRLSGEVRVTNRGGTPETLVFADGCPVRLRVYEARGARMAPVWEGPRDCPAEPVAVAIAAGDWAVLPVPATTADQILEAELPDGTYRVTVWLAPESRVIEIEAGEVDLRTPR